MMSLFSNFDYYFFKTPLVVMIVVLVVITFKFNKFSYKNMIFNKFLFTLSSIIYMNKRFAFNKFTMNLFTSMLMILLVLNLFAVFSYNFAMTSQTKNVLSYSLSFWLILFLFQFSKSSSNLLSHFIPMGSPLAISPILFLIEIVSFMIRPVTLTVRLVANILAGHLLMILLYKLVMYFNMCFFIYIMLNVTEMFISFIQAYIFVTLISLYYKDV